MNNYICNKCGFELWQTVSTFNTTIVSTLGLYNDARFPGRCILVLDDHYEDFASLNKDMLMTFMIDVQVAGKAIKTATGADRINYAILGNAVSHVHCHIIPRVFKDDPNPTGSPWSRNDKAFEMPKDQCNEIIKKIQSNLLRSAYEVNKI